MAVYSTQARIFTPNEEGGEDLQPKSFTIFLDNRLSGEALVKAIAVETATEAIKYLGRAKYNRIVVRFTLYDQQFEFTHTSES